MEQKSKNAIEVIIGGEVITLMGVESEEYIQKIARYIDRKLLELLREKKSLGVNSFMKTLLIAVNIADDLFKEKEKKDQLETDLIKYMDELGKIQQENFLLNEKLQEMQMELSSTKKELVEYMDAFYETDKKHQNPIPYRK